MMILIKICIVYYLQIYMIYNKKWKFTMKTTRNNYEIEITVIQLNDKITMKHVNYMINLYDKLVQ